MTLEEMQFYSAIKNGLAEHPEWMGTAINAVMAGSSAAVEKANKRADQAQFALLSALALVSDNRINSALKEQLNAQVIRAGIFGLDRNEEISNVPAMCEFERQFIRNAAKAIDENSN